MMKTQAVGKGAWPLVTVLLACVPPPEQPATPSRLGSTPCARDITERPRAPSGVAAFVSAHSKTPYITPSIHFPSGKGVVRGRRGQQL